MDLMPYLWRDSSISLFLSQVVQVYVPRPVRSVLLGRGHRVFRLEAIRLLEAIAIRLAIASRLEATTINLQREGGKLSSVTICQA